jgi:tetratricopeptide (TPR) repeat protein
MKPYNRKFNEFKRFKSFKRQSKVNVTKKMAWRYFKLAFNFYEKNDFEKAIEFYSRSIRLNSKYASAYYNRGLACGRLNENERAIEDFNLAIKLKPDYWDAFNNRGYAFDLLGETDKALSDYSAAIENGLANISVYNNRARIYAKKGLIDSAAEGYAKSLQIKESAQANCGLGIIFYDRKDFQKAFELFNRAIELNPASGLYYQNRGNANYFLEKYEEAIADYTKAIELKNNHLEWAYRGRAKAHEKLGNWKQADKDNDVFYKIKLNLFFDESGYIN